MIVHLHTLVYNEIDRLPFAIPYWKLCATHVFVYLMSSSNDGSREFLKSIGDFVTIEEIEDSDGFNDKRNMILKNEVWKKSRGVADFVIVNDFDEFIYSKDLISELKYMKDNNMSIVSPEIYHLINKDVILDNLNHEEFLHKQIKFGFYDKNWGKHIIFDPNIIEEINYGPGSHHCNPISNKKILYYDKNNIYLFHAKFLGLDWYLNKENELKNRLSNTNIRCGYGFHYNWENEVKINEFMKKFDNSVSIFDL